MFFEPQLMGKELFLRTLPQGSPSKDLRLGRSIEHLSLNDFRETLWKEAKELNPWELPPQFLTNLLGDTQSARVGIFAPKVEWAEASNLLHLLKDYSSVQFLGIRISGLDLNFHPLPATQKLRPNTLNTLDFESNSPAEIPDLLLIPGLAADLKGRRIGRGKGFYDRYLTKHPQVKVALLIHSQFLFDELPAHFFHKGDQRVHYVLTENKFYKITNGNEVPL